MKLPAMLLLFIAIAFEIMATTSLKLSEGFTRWIPAVIMVVGYVISFYVFSLSIKEIPLGVAYAIWSGVGTVGTVIVGVLLWQEGLDFWRIIGIGMIVGGVLVLNLLSKTAVH